MSVRRPADGPGTPEPLGVTLTAHGINVAVHSAHATAIELCLFDAGTEGEAPTESVRVALMERTGDVFHGFVRGVRAGQRYGLRAHGPFDPRAGHRFNPAKLLLDPHATRLDGPFLPHPAQFGHKPGEPDADLAADTVDSAPFVPKAVVEGPFDPGPVTRPRVPWGRTVIYECHLKGYTALHPEVPEELRGTFAGLGHPAAVDYLKRLGVTTLEILPAMAWADERHLAPLGLRNAWGYNPIAFCAPDPRLAPGGWAEVRAAVAALHAAGIEVILDVVLNHSAESDELGPTLSLRGLDNASYYRLRPDDRRYYVNDTGCGNTLPVERPALMRLALDALRTWATRAGLDGFRFDLAATLGRTDSGFDPNGAFLSALSQDPLLRDLKLIAEPWDIGPGGYRPGGFPAGWGEWNDRFRDDMRHFWRGDGHKLGALATRLAGSADLFGAKRRPSRSVNFIVAHDGFSLADLVSYQAKHNEANGEHNRDGTDDNASWNHGVEGPSDDPAVTAARRRDMRALIATLMVARGTPMLGMGAEAGRTQDGNNNAYAQDNRLNWLDHGAIDAGLYEFTRRAIALRQAHPALRADHFLTGDPNAAGVPDVEWLRADGQALAGGDWDGEGPLVAVFAAPAETGDIDRVAVIVNRAWEARTVAPPWNRAGHGWRQVLDSGAAADGDGDDAPVAGPFPVGPRTVLVLAEQPADEGRRRSPPTADLLDRYARAVGVAPDWWDEMGGHHPVPDQTKRALLGAMGLDAETLGAVRDGLERLSEEGPFRPLPRTVVGTAGQALRLVVPLADAPALDLAQRLEDGTARVLKVALDGRRLPVTAPDGRRCTVVEVTLDALPAGVHRLCLANRPEIAATLVVAPPRAHLPPALGEARRFGVGAHLYALRRAGDQGVGDFTTLARLGTGAGALGAVTVGINPLHALFNGDRDRASPYQPSDRRFLDPLYIDLAALGDADPAGAAALLLAAEGAALDQLLARRAIDYPAVWALKRRALAAAHAGFRDLTRRQPDHPVVDELATFVRAGGESLQRFARFQALAEIHAGPWTHWPEAARVADAPVAPEGLDFPLWLQWLADRQLAAADRAARQGGLALGFYRDLAVGAAFDGAETWGNRAEFALDASIGAPPDLFSAEGQVWNLPPPNPLAQEANAGAAFAELLAANMRHAGLLRIDHVMGLKRLFWVPKGAAGRDGAYVAAPFDLLLARTLLESLRAGVAVVGEDLGTVPEGFRERLGDAGILSYRVLWFEREGERFRDPARWPANAAACVSTHDLPTLAGWWMAADIAEKHTLGLLDETADAQARVARREEKRGLLDQLVGAGLLTATDADLDGPLDDTLAAAIHAFVTAAPSTLMLAQVDDLAGEVDAVNLPGTDRERPNWRRRLGLDVDALLSTGRSRAIMAAVAQGRQQ
ncbi:glycogen debranching protein GlgX [Nitrospirillum viridazoti]|uniref:4-alpha-glucanotransferase n=3 Tax=Nitrospirillum TaxID=1543705 RepID=A0A560HP23_9PROT|nr:glycogen debranching protein GlgX [Nitrospirillum amazonense]TWB48263.1 glycogen operon protein [Nitrospirillum amazonense]